jgi:hypothetical protein
MKGKLLVALMILAGASLATAQKFSSSTDVLGAHLNYGRGCTACHAPHSGAGGNGEAKTADGSSGAAMLWGEDASSLYGKTIQMSGGVVEILPSSMSANTPDVYGMLACLSCHDGNYASGATMKNRVYEPLPPNYGRANAIPTLLGNDGTSVGNYINDHPAGLGAKMSCGGTSWDCTIKNGEVQMTGSRSSQFVANYGFFIKPGAYNNTAVVVCTTCHNQHVMNVVTIKSGMTTGLPPGTYSTMFFLRAPYNPGSVTVGSNQAAQFCRQCHASESNEFNGASAGTVF